MSQVMRLIRRLVDDKLRMFRMHLCKGRPLPFSYNGNTYYVNPDKSATYHIHNSTLKIQRLVDLIDDPPDVIFDVGANCGLFSSFVERKFPSSRIYCFEPSKELIRMIKMNCSSAVNVFPIALGDSDKEASLFINMDSQQTNSLNRQAVSCLTDDKRIVEKKVSCRSIDSVADQEDISKIDVLKIDVQGAECEVLRGARKMLPTVKTLFIESTWVDIDSIVSLVPFAWDHGFKYIGVVNPVYLGADLIFTRTPLGKRDPGLLISRHEITNELLTRRWGQ